MRSWYKLLICLVFPKYKINLDVSPGKPTSKAFQIMFKVDSNQIVHMLEILTNIEYWSCIEWERESKVKNGCLIYDDQMIDKFMWTLIVVSDVQAKKWNSDTKMGGLISDDVWNQSLSKWVVNSWGRGRGRRKGWTLGGGGRSLEMEVLDMRIELVDFWWTSEVSFISSMIKTKQFKHGTALEVWLSYVSFSFAFFGIINWK